MSHEARLLIGLVVAVAAVVGMIARLKLHAFPALLLAALGLGLFAGAAPDKVATALTTGFGQVLAGVGPVVGLGAMLGGLVQGGGGATRLAASVTRAAGPRGAVWAMAGAAMVIGAPLFFETGVVLMMPLILAVGAELDGAEPGRSGVVRSAMAAFAGLSVMHGLVPPHPGPLIALDALQAPLGRTFLSGLAMALPITALAGPLYGSAIARFAQAAPPRARDPEAAAGRPAGVAATLAPLLLPVLLILLRAAADLVLGPASPLRAAADLLGAPTVALLAAVLLAWLTLGVGLGLKRGEILERAGSGLPAIASILLVIGAGGAFKAVLVEIGIGPALAALGGAAHLPPLMIGWLLAVLVRLATGSATVATITASGAMAAAIHAGVVVDPALLVLAIGGGSLFFSHVNDAGFWMVREYLGLSVSDTFKTWSVMETIVAIGALVLALVANVLLH